MFLFVTLFYFFLLYRALRDYPQTMFLMFVACLPFAKGKSFEFILIPVGEIPKFGLYDVGYYFPIHPSALFLVGLLYIFFRQRTDVLKYKRIHNALIGLAAFVCIAIIPMFYSLFPIVIGLSVLQVALISSVFFLPYWLRLSPVVIRRLSHIIAAFTIFESGWIFAQILYSGPLGRYLEATLPLNRSGILSTEDSSLMRFNGTFYEPSIMSTFMLMHFCYFLILIMDGKYSARFEKKIYLVALIGALFSIIFSGSRGVYGLTFLSSYFMFRAGMKRFLFRKLSWPRLRMGIIVCLTIVLLLFPYAMKRSQTVSTLFSQYGSGSFRQQLNFMATQLADKHLFGVGLNLSPYYLAYGFSNIRWVDPSHPHNLMFQILAETGFPGLIAFLLFLWIVYRSYILHATNRAKPFFAASILFLACAQFYPIFVAQPEILSYFFLHAGLMNWSIDHA